jgi:hypothetical protein
MRLLIVTSQFPIAGEPNRGRPIHQTVRELSKLADVRVLSPVARYPRWATWLPRHVPRLLPTAASSDKPLAPVLAGAGKEKA